MENVVMENISEIEAHQTEALDIIRKANLKRQVKKTKSNDSSSRSHAIITIKLDLHKKYANTSYQLISQLTVFVFVAVKFVTQVFDLLT